MSTDDPDVDTDELYLPPSGRRTRRMAARRRARRRRWFLVLLAAGLLVAALLTRDAASANGYHPRQSRSTEGDSLNAVDTSASRALALAAATAAADKKAADLRILDLGELLGITDFFVLMSASNERQLGTVVEEVERRLKQSLGRSPRREGTKDTGWMVLDYGDIVVHAFTQEQRAFYNLERLWSDAPQLPVPDPARS